MDEAVVVPVLSRRVQWRSRGGLVLVTAVRLALGTVMVFYGLGKVFAFQFQVQPWAYAQPLRNASGIGLLWSALGYAPWFQRTLGWLELVPAMLLLWSRTRRLGALLIFPVLANVVLFNFAMNLWHETKVISLVLLALDVLLILYDLPIYLTFLQGLLTPPVVRGEGRWQRTGVAVGGVLPVLILCGLTWFSVHLTRTLMDPKADFVGRRQINGAGTWRMESMVVGQQPVALAPKTMVLFGFDQTCRIGLLPMASEGTFEVNHAQHSFAIRKVNFAGSAAEYKGSYRVDGEHLRLDGLREGRPMTMVLVRDGWGPMP